MAARSRSRGSRSRAVKARRSSKPAPAHGRINSDNGITAEQEAVASRVTEECMDAFKNGLKPEGNSALQTGARNDIRALYEIVRASLDVFDSMLAELVLDPPMDCKRGCIYCCVNQVSLTPPEALFLGFHLLETRTPQQLLELHARARTLSESLKGKSRQEIGMTRHLYPCLFMENGTCSIYPARPLVCRGWNSVNAQMCKHSNQSGDALAPIENHPLPRLLAASVQTGLLQGARDLGLETGFLLLTRAVLLLLEGGAEHGVMNCTTDWLEGRPFFARISTLIS
ncbi:YkgJ family cysteine cluster protein [Maridesulfovibrio sp.]|uniref:YkgJ family cysteine cluster protein n=1 Tax=Maridesulfovibrio sp. TaxID=2795000 RepID=UPI002A187807|nr:YkgJ family cysteine cluster protein [Maridesulfovibrio sp.]